MSPEGLRGASVLRDKLQQLIWPEPHSLEASEVSALNPRRKIPRQLSMPFFYLAKEKLGE